MGIKLHRDGKLRRWLGRKFGGDEELGDRLWRRCLHFFGAAVLVYYLLPPRFFLISPNEVVLLLALELILVLELLRHVASWELPTIRPFERERVASFTWYAIALVGAVILLARPVAVVVVLGTAFVDPVLGELRARGRSDLSPWLPVGVYFSLGFPALVLAYRWGWVGAALAVLVAAFVAVAVERPDLRLADDDLVMTAVPAALLTLWLYVMPGLPALSL